MIALDAAGQQSTGYSGTASLAETGAATTSSLPTSLTFHHGESDFQGTFTGTGTGTFTATETDTVNTTPITGDGSTNVNPATTATQLVVFIPAHETAGQAVNVVVERRRRGTRRTGLHGHGNAYVFDRFGGDAAQCLPIYGE